MAIEHILLILVLICGFYMAWNIGANDVSNAMGTSVGSGALTLFKAVVIAGVLEFAGAFFLGSNVSETLQSGIVDPGIFDQDPNILLYGMIASLLATAVWLQVASYFRWPVSTTHAIVGAIIGFGAVIGGMHAVHWGEVGNIALGWVISPVLSALFSFFLFSILQRKVLFSTNPIKSTLRLIPVFVFIVFMTFILSVISDGIPSLNEYLSSIEKILLSSLLSALCAFGSYFLIRRVASKAKLERKYSPYLSQQLFSMNKVVKHLRRVFLSSKGTQKEKVSNLLSQAEEVKDTLQEKSQKYTKSSDYQVVEKMFAFLQILSAAYVAFGHGANDVANAIGPVAASLEIIKSKSLSLHTEVPTWLLAFGGVGIVVGLATWGWRVMETIGKKITELTPTRGFCAEFGAAITILFASKLGLPVSTTHCIVGAVLGVGLAKGIAALNLRVLREIVLSWVITIPSSAIACILFFYLIKAIFN